MLRYYLCRGQPTSNASVSEDFEVIGPSNIIEKSPQAQVHNVKEVSPKPEKKKQSTLLELSGQCNNVKDVADKYAARRQVSIGEVFVFGHRQSSVVEGF